MAMRPPIREIYESTLMATDQPWRRAYSGTPLPVRCFCERNSLMIAKGDQRMKKMTRKKRDRNIQKLFPPTADSKPMMLPDTIMTVSKLLPVVAPPTMPKVMAKSGPNNAPAKKRTKNMTHGAVGFCSGGGAAMPAGEAVAFGGDRVGDRCLGLVCAAMLSARDGNSR